MFYFRRQPHGPSSTLAKTIFLRRYHWYTLLASGAGLARSRLCQWRICRTDQSSEYQAYNSWFSILRCLLLITSLLGSNCFCAWYELRMLNLTWCMLLSKEAACPVRYWHRGGESTTETENSPLTYSQPITTRRLYLSLRICGNHWTSSLMRI